MTEPGRTEESPDEAQAMMSAALRNVLYAGARDTAPLRTSVTDYVRARKNVGLRPEEVVIELKAEIASTLQRQPAALHGTYDPADVIAEQLVRLAIEAYFAD